MSKGSKQQYKQFTINTVEDACLVLKTILVPVIIDLEKFEKYSLEAEALLKSTLLGECVPAEIYDSLHDKILYQQRELLRFIADCQSSSFSYIEIRKIFIKKGFLKRNLSDKSRNILNELLNIRNWTFHNVQSMLVADLEVAKKSIPPELRNIAEIKPMLNPVVIRKYTSYERGTLEQFVEHNKIRYEEFQCILKEMKVDYQNLIEALPEQSIAVSCLGTDENVQYIVQEIEAMNPNNAGGKIASMSMGIQKGKYDGSDEMFNKLVGDK